MPKKKKKKKKTQGTLKSDDTKMSNNFCHQGVMVEKSLTIKYFIIQLIFGD